MTIPSFAEPDPSDFGAVSAEVGAKEILKNRNPTAAIGSLFYRIVVAIRTDLMSLSSSISALPAAPTLTAVKTSEYAAGYREIVQANATGGAFSIHLPTAVGKTADDFVTVKKSSASTNTITIDQALGQTIDGAASYAMADAWQSATFIPDGTNWLAFPTAS